LRKNRKLLIIIASPVKKLYTYFNQVMAQVPIKTIKKIS
jgi:hypothetical protein